jgi:uncharacterized repeat protein (TIGR03803 family)
MAQPQIAASIFDMNLRARTAVLVTLAILAAILTVVSTAEAQTYHMLYTFTGGADGNAPDSGVIVDGSGTVYGVAAGGGSHNCAGGCGTVFRLTNHGSSWTFATLHSFQGEPDGYLPVGLVKGPDGSLYGATLGGGQGGQNYCGYGVTGCGTIFNLKPPASFCRSVSCPWNETVLYRFQGTTAGDGANPSNGAFAFDSSGNLYGTTSGGGTYAFGTVFKMTHSQGGWTEATLYSLNGGGSSGWGYPESGPLLDRSGNIYGTTILQNQYAGGVVYELSPSGGSWTANVLHPFQCSGADGCGPGGLIADAAGNLYVGTSSGGADGGGTADELLASQGWTLNTLFSFPGGGGSGPQGTLAMDAAGNLYGATDAQGTFGAGTVFKLTPSGGGWSMTVLYNFTGGADGGYPVSGVVIDSHGNIFGTTNAGGSGICQRGCGVVWEITP